VLKKFREVLEELGQTLCETVAGGYGQAEVLSELREELRELGQTLCETVAGGYGQAEVLREIRAAPRARGQRAPPLFEPRLGRKEPQSGSVWHQGAVVCQRQGRFSYSSVSQTVAAVWPASAS
jgi:RNA-splicing ligase RtcB